MWAGFDLIATNLNVSFENIILIVMFLGGLVFAAKDFRLATIYWFVASGGLFLWFYNMAQNGQSVVWAFAIAFFFIALVMLALNLFNIRRNAEVV